MRRVPSRVGGPRTQPDILRPHCAGSLLFDISVTTLHGCILLESYTEHNCPLVAGTHDNVLSLVPLPRLMNAAMSPGRTRVSLPRSAASDTTGFWVSARYALH